MPALGPSLRKLVLAVHVAVSVGWIGAVLAYLPFDLAAATSADAGVLRAAYAGMDLIAARVLVPLALAALATGILVSLGTSWGLFRHYWVLVSLVLTTLCAVVLLNEARVIADLAATARDPATTDDAVRALPSTLPHSIGGLLVLLVVLVLNVYKPRGLTRYGWRRQREADRPP